MKRDGLRLRLSGTFSGSLSVSDDESKVRKAKSGADNDNMLARVIASATVRDIL